MTSDRDDQLLALFKTAEQDLPGEPFTADVIARLSAHRRRITLLQGSGIAMIVIALYLLSPEFAERAADFPNVVFDLASRSLHALSESSLLAVIYLYGGVFGGYLLLRALQRMRIRWV
jgi:hypothetical protein